MLACPNDSKPELPVCNFLPSPIQANHFQPPLVSVEPSPLVTGHDAVTVLVGGVAFGFACGINAAILAYAVAGKELNFLALGFGLALAALVGVRFYAGLRGNRTLRG